MPGVMEQFGRLQFELIDMAMRFAGSPTEDEVSAACADVWARVQGNRKGNAPIRFDDFKLLYEATLDRCKAIMEVPQPEAPQD